MSYNLLLINFNYALDRLLQHFLIETYSYQLIDGCIYLHLKFKSTEFPMHIKITNRSLYAADSLYLALYEPTIQLIQNNFRNYNFISYAYNQYNNIMYCIIDFDDLKRYRLISNCLVINDDSFNETRSFSSPVVIRDKVKIFNNNRFGFIEWNDIFDKEFEKDFV